MVLFVFDELTYLHAHLSPNFCLQDLSTNPGVLHTLLITILPQVEMDKIEGVTEWVEKTNDQLGKREGVRTPVTRELALILPLTLRVWRGS